MANVVRCPRCSKSYRISTAVIGRRVQCRNCGEMFEAADAAQPCPSAVDAASSSHPDAAHDSPTGNGTRSVPTTLTGPLEVRPADGFTVVRILAPRIDSANVEEIGAALLALADDPAHKNMVLNLSQVEFLFSTALGKLVALEKKLQAKRGSLRLCELRRVVHESMDSAGLTLILRIFASEEQALAAKN